MLSVNPINPVNKGDFGFQKEFYFRALNYIYKKYKDNRDVHQA
jgi:hypothetical protein